MERESDEMLNSGFKYTVTVKPKNLFQLIFDLVEHLCFQIKVNNTNSWARNF